MLLVGTATVSGWTLVTQRLPHMIADWRTAVSSHPWVVPALTVLLYLIFSDLLEGLLPKVFWIYVLVLMAGLLVIAFFPAITLVALKLNPVS
jgi:TRAP-type C4-dicarboxylate transport system permease large subunit